MLWTVVLVFFLFLTCALLLVAEVFVPSGGLITVFALGCLVGGITLCFQSGLIMGWIGVGGAVVLVPTTLVIAYRIFPKTRFGKTVTLTPPSRSRGDAIPDTTDLLALMGKTGTVIKPLRPVGICDFSGRKVECVAENGYVEPQQRVVAIRIEGTQVTVRTHFDSK